MFNLGKSNSDKEELKKEASNLLDNVKDSSTELASEVKKSSNYLQNEAKEAIYDSKAEILTLISSLKGLLADTDYAGNARQMRDQVLAKAGEWKNKAADEIMHATDVSVVKTRSIVREQPLASVAIAVSAGVIIGYILGNKSSSK